MKTNETYLAEYFIFRIFNDENGESVGLASNSDKFYVYPPTNKDELKGLAEFILRYLDKVNEQEH